jgi:hypothetical protein
MCTPLADSTESPLSQATYLRRGVENVPDSSCCRCCFWSYRLVCCPVTACSQFCCDRCIHQKRLLPTWNKSTQLSYAVTCGLISLSFDGCDILGFEFVVRQVRTLLHSMPAKDGHATKTSLRMARCLGECFHLFGFYLWLPLHCTFFILCRLFFRTEVCNHATIFLSSCRAENPQV